MQITHQFQGLCDRNHHPITERDRPMGLRGLCDRLCIFVRNYTSMVRLTIDRLNC
ncbi:MAG: hypothetical protein HC860_19930 [Alkalinema sp. RU_4_3]|nr:hypothetical protein [Alkalinema sp. RU_4_3]